VDRIAPRCAVLGDGHRWCTGMRPLLRTPFFIVAALAIALVVVQRVVAEHALQAIPARAPPLPVPPVRSLFDWATPAATPAIYPAIRNALVAAGVSEDKVDGPAEDRG
jgi:hypothetical protein